MGELKGHSSEDRYKSTELSIRSLTLLEVATLYDFVALLPLADDGSSWMSEIADLISPEILPSLLPKLNMANRQALERLPRDDPNRPLYELKNAPGVFYLPSALSPSFCNQEIGRCAQEYMYFPGATTNVSSQPISPSTHPPASLFWPPEGATRLRWISLGCQYNWTKRVYAPRGYLPEPLAKMAVEITDYVRKVDCSARTSHWHRYAPDCALVNYYHRGDRLRGHVDDVEEALEMPLVSFSFGQPAIFLMGGLSRSQTPIPIVLRDGDCLILSGESRCAYHGVPKLLKWPHALPMADPPNIADTTRVNISIRQCWRTE